ncbi:MAG: Asp-tRNA(Asn)/Glu-tRNA(Gln) amidotransferase subunit GatB [Patescibacteria group bacterium]
MYEPVIGLEVHAQISTKTKMFCGCSNDSFTSEPNTNVCPVCMGFPGQLPVLNELALEKGVIAALALHLEIPEFSKFDRKNYFYPDLPKGYQISQYDKPVSKNGFIEIYVGNEIRKVRLNRLHLEDDAGKLTHTAGGTLCDYNRSGCPLMEVVSEPDLYSIEEAAAYAEELRRILRYVGASDCDMEKGMMRFDLNISLRKKGEKKLGTKVEVKNLNSFRSLEKALRYEIKRQADVLDSGEKISQETRGWDDAQEITVSQRSKEEAHDYRYFPEPDLPPLQFSREKVEKLRELVVELPLTRRLRFIEQYGVSEADSETLTQDFHMADYFEKAAKVSGQSKKAASFIGTVLLKHLNESGKGVADSPVSADHIARLIIMVEEGIISNNQAKGELFAEMYRTGKSPDVIVEEKGLKQVSDTGALDAIVKKVIENNPSVVTDFKNGKDAAIGFLVGQLMKESKGQANPRMANQMLRDALK